MWSVISPYLILITFKFDFQYVTKSSCWSSCCYWKIIRLSIPFQFQEQTKVLSIFYVIEVEIRTSNIKLGRGSPNRKILIVKEICLAVGKLNVDYKSYWKSASDWMHLIMNFLINSEIFPVPEYHLKARSTIVGNI